MIKTLYEQSVEFEYPEDAFDMICESYRNVSCLFKEAEKEVQKAKTAYHDQLKQANTHRNHMRTLLEGQLELMRKAEKDNF